MSRSTVSAIYLLRDPRTSTVLSHSERQKEMTDEFSRTDLILGHLSFFRSTRALAFHTFNKSKNTARQRSIVIGGKLRKPMLQCFQKTCRAPAEFLDNTVWHPLILTILLHNVVFHPYNLRIYYLVVIGTRCFKFPTQALTCKALV